jgi:hypothetical protein
MEQDKELAHEHVIQWHAAAHVAGQILPMCAYSAAYTRRTRVCV